LTSSRRTDRPAADPPPAEYHRGVSSGRRLSGNGGAFAFDTGSLTGTALLLAAPEPSTTWWHWVIRLREEKRLTGTVQATITPAEHGWAAEVAWVVGTPRQRRDIATEAARGLFARLLQQDVRVIRVHIHPDHHASAAAAGLAPTDH
jgi:hypothetical protein